MLLICTWEEGVFGTLGLLGWAFRVFYFWAAFCTVPGLCYGIWNFSFLHVACTAVVVDSQLLVYLPSNHAGFEAVPYLHLTGLSYIIDFHIDADIRLLCIA